MKQTLKKLSMFMLAFTLTVASMDAQAQVPQKFNYQGIARDAKGNPLSQQRMTLKLTVLPTSDATEGEYEEIQTVTTNEFGLYTLQIGNGSPLKGEMSAVKWETGNKYIKVAIDPKGGSDFVDAGTNQLLSVPYAIYADKAGVAKNSGSTSRATNNFIEKTNGSGVVNSTSQIYDNGTNIGIGTTTPSARVHVNANSATVQEHIRMQNLSSTGAGRFTMYNNNTGAYATFTKYGTNYAGGYTGISSLYPYANLLAFGNNDTNGAGNGRFLISTEGNTGISIFKGGTSKLKYHVDYATENVGIGGNAVPAARVHANNTDGTSMELMLSNNTTGHTATDGFMIQQSGSDVNLNNKENGNVRLWSNNLERARITAAGDVGIGTTAPTAKLDVNGQIRMQGGSPGVGKIMTSNATGVGSWSTAAAAGLVSGSGTTDYIPKFTPNGTTLGNSKLADNATGLIYNAPTAPSLSDLIYLKPAGNGGSSWMTLEGVKATSYTFVNMVDSGFGNKGTIFGQSSALYNSNDSAGFIIYNPNIHSTALGTYNAGGIVFNNSNGKFGNGYWYSPMSGNAHFNINTIYDTAGYFTSSSSNWLSKGILRAEYTGPTGLTNDNIAVYGKSKPVNNYGFGVYGEGGYYGVYGITDSFGAAGVGAYASGTATGIYGSSQAGTAVNASSNYGNAITASTYGQDRYGVSAYSGGTNGQGVYGYGDSIGTHGSARFIGAYNEANNSFGSGYSYGTNTMATSTVGRSYGINASAVGGNASWNSYGIYAEATGSAATLYAGYFNGQIYATTGTFGTKPFTIDHPLDPANKVLRHSSIESPDMMNIYNGNITTDANGFATVELPDYFDALNENFKYQLTVIGTFAQAIIKDEIANNKFVIQTNVPNVKVSWQVSGVRHDAVAKKFPVIVEEAKTGENKGHYFEPAAYGVSNTLRIGYQEPATNENLDSQALNMKKEFENKQRIEAEHKANNEKALKNWKQQEATKDATKGTVGSLVPVK